MGGAGLQLGWEGLQMGRMGGEGRAWIGSTMKAQYSLGLEASCFSSAARSLYGTTSKLGILGPKPVGPRTQRQQQTCSHLHLAVSLRCRSTLV